MRGYILLIVCFFLHVHCVHAGVRDDLPLNVKEAIAQAERETAAGLQEADQPNLRSQIYGRLGLVYQAQSLMSLAEETYRLALAEFDFDPWSYLLGMVLTEQGSFTEAIEVFDTLATKQELPDVLSHLVFFRVGRVHLAMGSVEMASKRLESALALNRSAVVLSALADVAIAQKDLSLAKQRLESAIEIDPKAGQLSYKLALVLRDLGQPEKAKQRLEERNTIAPIIDDPLLLEVAQFNMSSRFFLDAAERAWKRNNREEALLSYERAVVLDPDNLTTGLALVRAYDGMGYREKAGDLIGHYLDKYPDDSESWYGAGYIRRADANSTAAHVALDKALDLDSDMETRSLRAGLYLRDGQLLSALEDYKLLVEANSNNASYRYMLGLTRMKMGDCLSSLIDFDEVLSIEPQWGRAHLIAIRIQSICGTADRKQSALDRARYLVTRQNDIDTRLTVAFAALGLGRRELAAGLIKEDIDHPDARLIQAAIRAGSTPAQPFDQESDWWLAGELL